MKAPYNPIDVANYIVWRANAMGNPVTHLKLQKLLYYVVAKYLQTHDKHLIDEKVVKWQYGPVIKSVYHSFKVFGQNLITAPKPYLTTTDVFNLEFAEVEKINNDLNNDNKLKNVVNFVLNQLVSIDAFDLVERTHQEPAWGDYEELILRAREEMVYSAQELKMANI